MKLFLTPKEVWEHEGYGGKCAIIGVVGAVIFAISLAFVTDDMPRKETAEYDPVVQQQEQAALPEKYSHHVMAVVKYNDCYSFGGNTGWVKSVCYSTYEEAYQEKIEFEAFLATEREHENADWKRVIE